MDQSLVNYTRMIQALHSKWMPHAGQIPVGRAIFSLNKKSVFLQCGRKLGKTEVAIYTLWRIAMTYPNSPCYYIAPLQTQAKEILWEDPRLVTFGPREWLLPGSQGVNNTELRITFTNGSFIKVDGSDNYNKYRGIRYKVAVYDEYKDHRPEFRLAMRPNASVLDGVDLFMGSPPDRDCDYTALADEHKKDPTCFYFKAPTRINPHIDKAWLAKERERLYARGEGDQWEREYEAEFVKGGTSKVFPMLKESMVKPHDEIMAKLWKDRKKMQYFLWADPAAATCFAVLFMALNPFTKEWYALDEIYETDQGLMSVTKIAPRIFSARNELWDGGEWRQGYDEASTWFSNEMLDHCQEYFEPSQKAANKKDVGLTLIKDIMLAGKLTISDRCVKFYWELDNTYKDKSGKIPKVNDHLIDDFRYILGASAYTLNDEPEKFERDDEDFRGGTIEHEFRHVIERFEDWNS